ncbi:MULTISPECIES: thioredoxin family protein [Flavobacterium]|uniref:Thioredoxin family protein n=1 Tax=Flavobacterium gawalongense TaxID=2594432 RepID=A0A553BGK3_9FLAO|nr:thioredoxin family protein [Flavobacterium gawalongense]TRX00001.1 thioredoxin family protein [Flavobacterium gawalongense]TRX04769.1 thioredoxin family protein [Flavobacterium gawalongense]TRX07355.1 thioredoxin family protein [Flavobacterium gawalongense]TRX08372.1 thioredoxin family protein [Flavobacterium gawalongense]TRX24439.1 thioredoxin family protein [Flavobacterium gawalongense]
MKKSLLLLFLLIGTLGYSQNWKVNFEEAKAEAAKENKNILLVFSGSDWCAPCMKLEKVVWKSEDFQMEAEKKWVLYKADFPKKKANQLSPELSESNKKLAEKYNKNGSFPLVVLLDKTGKVIGITGFKNVSASDYIKLIHSLEVLVKDILPIK